MELKSIMNLPQLPHNKIQHQIDNEGCKCYLCQKVIIKEMKLIKKCSIEDNQSELTKGKKQQFFSKFVLEFAHIDKLNRKVKVIFPQLCIFQKAVATCLISKKRQTLPVKVIRNKEKLNGFEINNFFIDGYTFHNNVKEPRKCKQNSKLRRQYHHHDDALKNQCIVLAKFVNGSCQMMTPTQLTNLFKSKQTSIRQELLYLSTLVCSQNYQEIRISINLQDFEGSALLERAKNQVKMINEDIKPKDFSFIPERQERKFQEVLKDENPQKYLEYISIKLLLLYSLRTDVLLKECMFKFVKDQIDTYYFVDLQVYSRISANKIWGTYQNIIKIFPETPEKIKKMRPTSSPQLLQKRKITLNEKPHQREVPLADSRSENKKKMVMRKGRRIGSIRLEPIPRKIFNTLEH